METRKEVKRQRGKRKKEGQTLTKNTWRGARRKIFPHKHVLFHKSSKLSWNELEKKPERKVVGREETERMRGEYFSHVPSCPVRCRDMKISYKFYLQSTFTSHIPPPVCPAGGIPFLQNSAVEVIWIAVHV